MTCADDMTIAALRRTGWCRRVLGLAALLVALVCLAAPGRARAFDLEDVAAKARSLAAQPYHDTKGEVPDWLMKIDYDQWRDIRFRPDHALWKKSGLPFQVQFFHPGLYYDHTVAINVVSDEGVKPVEFSTDQFDYGKNDFAGRVPSQPRLRWLSRPLPAQPAGLQRRGDRLPRCQLLPRSRQPSGVRPLGTRHRHRHDRAEPRGVPLLPGVLAGPARRRREADDHLRAARRTERDRRLPVRDHAGRPDRGRRRHAGLSTSCGEQARHRTADQHVLPRREHAAADHRLPPRGARLRRPAAALLHRRMAVAADREPLQLTGEHLPDGEPARLRPPPARPRLRPPPGPGDAHRPAAERLDRHAGRLGTRCGRAGRDPHRHRHPRQHRLLLGAAPATRAGRGGRLLLHDVLVRR